MFDSNKYLCNYWVGQAPPPKILGAAQAPLVSSTPMLFLYHCLSYIAQWLIHSVLVYWFGILANVSYSCFSIGLYNYTDIIDTAFMY